MSWIKLDRKLREWRWRNDAPTMTVWVNILLEANWQDKEWKNTVIPRGSFITSVSHLAVICGLTPKQTRRALSNLSETGEIEKFGANKWTTIKVCNYDSYQLSEGDAGQTKGKQRANKGQQLKNIRIQEDNISTNNLSQDNKLTTTNNPSLVVAKSKDFSTESKDSVLKKRAKVFAETIRPYIERYGKEMCREFWEYWTEPNKSHTKMRFEMERTWDIARRLGYWNNRKGMTGKVRAETEPISRFAEAAEQSARMAERMDERERQQREQESQIDYGALRQISEVRH